MNPRATNVPKVASATRRRPRALDLTLFSVPVSLKMRTWLLLPVCPDYSVGGPIFLWAGDGGRVLGTHGILVAVNQAAKRQIAMIFDLDGVLVHSMPLHVLAWE